MKPVPLIVTAVPPGPLVGVKLLMVGAGITVKSVALVAIPPAVSTWMGPVVAPVGTDVVIWLSLITVNDGWFVPLKRTAVAPVNPVPVTVTAVPSGPLVGEKPVIVGTAMTVKSAALVAVPPGVSTWMGPVVAPTGTVVLICVSLTTVKLG